MWKIANITKMIYLPRQSGHFLIALAACIYVYNTGMTPWFYVLAFMTAIAWPLFCLWLSQRVVDVKRYELLCLTYIDTYLVAIWAPICSFSLWYVVFIISGMGMALISIGGWRMLLKGLLAIICSFLSIGMAMYLFSNNFMFYRPTPLLGIISSSMGTICFAYVIASYVYVRSLNLKRTKTELYESNDDISRINQIMKAANSSLNIEDILDNIISILKEIFYFDFISIQLYDNDKKTYIIYAISGVELNKYIQKAWHHIHINGEDAKTILHLFDNKKYEYIENVTLDNLSSPLEQEMYKIRPFEAVAMFPLVLDQENKGIISFYFLHTYTNMNDALLDKLNTYVSNFAIVINNALLFVKLKKSQEEIHLKNEELANLSGKLSHYLSPQVYESIFSGEQDVKIEAKRKKLTVFFSDITGFTELTDRIESEVLTSMLNTYLTRMSAIAMKYGGTIDKYIGDAILIFFGDPLSKGARHDALDCTRMAIEMRDELDKLKQLWVGEGFAESLSMRMGINTGYCNVGNFGSEYRMDYTIIGSQVNLTSRIQYAAGPGEILVSEETYLLIKDEVACERLDPLVLKGISHPVQAYRVIAMLESRS